MDSPPLRPFVRVKLAASLDGITALPDGRSQWITSPQARLDGHRWRAQADVILTGIGTVLADDPRLDVRLPADEMDPAGRQPAVAVFDTRLRTPMVAALFAADRPVHVFAGPAAHPEREAALRQRGATVHRLPLAAGREHLPVAQALALLARAGMRTVHVEAGARLAGALLRAGCVDELLLYLAPTLLGAGRGLAELGGLAGLADGIALQWESVERVGPDLRVRVTLPRRSGCAGSPGR